MCFEEKYTYGETPNRKQIEDALEVLKCERLARWQMMMTEQEKAEIEQAHNLCIFMLKKALDSREDKMKSKFMKSKFISKIRFHLLFMKCPICGDYILRKRPHKNCYLCGQDI